MRGPRREDLEAFELAGLLADRDRRGAPYLEFLRKRDLSVGVYVLPRGSRDPQAPHTEDEVYAVLEGRGRIRVAGEDREVRRGSLVFVPARAEHRFHSIEEDLAVLVVFAPAEGSRSAGKEDDGVPSAPGSSG